MSELQRYVGNGYRVLNFGLRNGTKTALDAKVKALDRELDDSGKPVSAETTLYRKAGPYADFPAHALNDVFVDKAYLSTSTNVNNYGWTANHAKGRDQLFLTITPAIFGYARNIAAVCPNQQECEVLFHRNVRFQITHIETDALGNVHWRLQELDSPEAGYVWGKSS